MTFNRILFTSALAISTTLLAQPALALDTADGSDRATRAPVVVTRHIAPAPVRDVRFADLDLATAAGARDLDRRVRAAAHSVCTEALGSGAHHFDRAKCRSSARAGAEPQVAIAVQRAREIAATGSSNIAALTISVASE